MKKIGRTPKLVILRVGHDIKRMREVLLITHLTSTWQTLPCTSWQKCVNYPYKKHLKTSKDAEFEGSLFQNDQDTAWQSREIVLQILALLGREGACKMGRGAGGGSTYKHPWYLATLWRDIFDRFDCIVSGKFTNFYWRIFYQCRWLLLNRSHGRVNATDLRSLPKYNLTL